MEALNPLFYASLMAVAGNATHVLKRVVEARADGQKETIINYVKGHPYRIILGMIGSASAMGLLIELEQVTLMSAFMAGYMADSGLSILSTRFNRSYS